MFTRRGKRLDALLLQAGRNLDQLVPCLWWLEAILCKDLLIVPEPLDVELERECGELAIVDLLEESDRRRDELLGDAELVEG